MYVADSYFRLLSVTPSLLWRVLEAVAKKNIKIHSNVSNKQFDLTYVHEVNNINLNNVIKYLSKLITRLACILHSMKTCSCFHHNKIFCLMSFD